MHKQPEYEVIIVGTGSSGATLARELTRAGKNVLLLERGPHLPPRENLQTLARVSDEVSLGKKLTVARGLATGGSTILYFGVVGHPLLEVFARLGVDLTQESAAIKSELPIGALPDRLISAKARRLQESATDLGHVWRQHDMLIDPGKCEQHYSYEAIWRARAFVDEALEQGATLINHAKVDKVLIENNQAVGVEYTCRRGWLQTEQRRVYGSKIILCAGEMETPGLLRRSGFNEVGDRGFYCNPGYVLYGVVPGLASEESFVGSMGTDSVDGIELGDANICRFFHRLLMVGNFKPRHLLAYKQTIGIGVKVKDGLGGSLSAEGRLNKQFTSEEHALLDKGEQAARAVLARAGARHVANFGLVCAGRVGGMVEIGQHVDHRLETRCRNLHVCDGSVLPGEMRSPPTFTLLCLGRYLAGILTSNGCSQRI